MAKNWIAGATKNKGGLHRALGVPMGQPIPLRDVMAAAKKPGKVGQEARLALTLRGLAPNGPGKPAAKKKAKKKTVRKSKRMKKDSESKKAEPMKDSEKKNG